VYQPIEKAKTQIPIYAKSAGNLTLTLRAGKELVLKQVTAPVVAGLNYVDFDLSFDEKQTPQYQTWLNEKKEKDAKPIVLRRADDGLFYLQKGKYGLEIEKGRVKFEKELVIDGL
jgi:hypothetical protein